MTERYSSHGIIQIEANNDGSTTLISDNTDNYAFWC